MSEKKNEIMGDKGTVYQILTNAITRATTKMHGIRWTIENVSLLPLDTKIIGPDFHIGKTCLCNISFQLTKDFLFIYLHNKSDRTIKIERVLILFNSEGTELHHEKVGCLFTLQKDQDADVIGNIAQGGVFDSLKDDILLIDCYLKMYECYTKKIGFFEFEGVSMGKLTNDLKKIMNDPVGSDFTFQVGDETIYSHKAILRARSAYFKRMFETEMKESTENVLQINDVSHSAMLKLIEFLYTGVYTEMLQDTDIPEISDLYFAADKYEELGLKTLCAGNLVSIASPDSICPILQLAQRHDDEDLKIQAIDFISFHFDKVEISNSWKTLISSDIALAYEVMLSCFKILKHSL